MTRTGAGGTTSTFTKEETKPRRPKLADVAHECLVTERTMARAISLHPRQDPRGGLPQPHLRTLNKTTGQGHWRVCTLNPPGLPRPGPELHPWAMGKQQGALGRRKPCPDHGPQHTLLNDWGRGSAV